MGFLLEDVRADLRGYLRDSENLNRLLEDSTESSDEDLDRAIRFGLATFNMTTPLTSYTLDSASDEIYFFVINEAAIHVLISAGILYSRNRLNYSDGGLTIADSDKAGPYQSWIHILNQFRLQEKQYKIAANINSCYGSGYGSGLSSQFLSAGYNTWNIF
jgi:hypothetical protein